MFSVKVLIVCILVQLSAASDWREFIANEEDLVNTCVGTCESIPYLDHQPYALSKNCEIVKDCKKLNNGRNKGFVRCDYCKCQCKDNRLVIPEVIRVTTRKQFTEPDLFGTCTTTCPRSGLVRTNLGDCEEVRNCRKQYNGWTRGFVRCDYCVCDCIKHKTVNGYRLTNVVYRLDQAAISPGVPDVLEKKKVTNNQHLQQSSTATLSYEYTNSMSVESSTSVTAGLSITVEAGSSVGVVDYSLSTTAFFEAGFTQTTGEVEEKKHASSVAATMLTDPGQECEVQVVGTVRNLDVPYTANLVTTYDDGSEKVTPTSGIFSGIETHEFHVNYDTCTRISETFTELF